MKLHSEARIYCFSFFFSFFGLESPPDPIDLQSVIFLPVEGLEVKLRRSISIQRMKEFNMCVHFIPHRIGEYCAVLD